MIVAHRTAVVALVWRERSLPTSSQHPSLSPS